MRSVLLGFAAVLVSACATVPDEQTFEQNVTLIEEVNHSEIDPLDIFVKAKEAYASERYADSQDLYAQIITRDADNLSALIGYGDATIANGQFDLALAHFTALNEKQLDEDAQLQVNAGLTLAVIWSGEAEDPLSLVNIALRDNQEDPRLWSAKGQLLDRYELWLDAQDAYVKALKTGKVNSGTINNMGMSLLRQGRYAEARLKFEQAMELREDARLYDNNRRMTLFLEGQLIEGLEALPDDRASSLLNDAGFIAMNQGDFDRAQTLFEKALDISPSYHVKASENLKKLAELTTQSTG